MTDPIAHTPVTLDGAWQRLAELAARPAARDIRALFAANPQRAVHFSASCGDLTLDYSKTPIDSAAREALFDLARAADVVGFRARLFAGEAVNATEGRAAMHMALRSQPADGYTAMLPSGREPASQIAAEERARMAAFVAKVHSGELRGATGERFTDVLNIGIGGSDLGPRMVSEALTVVRGGKLNAHFLSNVDGHAFATLARELDPAHTLVLVASKTFTTLETMLNARAVRAWVADSLGEAAVGAHFAALSTNAKAVAAFGIGEERMFGFRDWVGGRYSVWSAIGLSVALAAGWEAFEALLAGGREMDQHFLHAPFAANLPVLLALVGIWHVDLMGWRSQCVLAYDQRLRRFPAYLQQLEMESNGKSVRLDGTPIVHPTCPALFGEPGTDAQHSFMQLVHQGSQVIPVDFLIAAVPDHDRPEAHLALAANVFAQAEALLRGKTLEEVRQEMLAKGLPPAEVERIAPHRVFTGNRPSNMLLFRQLDARTLGMLIALYEHKVAVQGAIWGIDSYDQWGVELGKVLAGGILPDLQPGAPVGRHDSSTSALIARFKALRS